MEYNEKLKTKNMDYFEKKGSSLIVADSFVVYTSFCGCDRELLGPLTGILFSPILVSLRQM